MLKERKKSYCYIWKVYETSEDDRKCGGKGGLGEGQRVNDTYLPSTTRNNA